MKWKIQTPSAAERLKVVHKEFINSKNMRAKYHENQWAANEEAVFASQWDRGLGNQGEGATPIDVYAAIASRAMDTPDSSMSISYIFKYVRFLHSQASANPPSCIPTPRTGEYADRRAALVADSFIHYGRKKLNVQNIQDLRTYGCLIHGTGISKLWWNKAIGPIKTDVANATVETLGDIDSCAKWVWEIYLDPTAATWDKCRFLYDKHRIPLQEAIARWPDQAKFLVEKKGVINDASGNKDKGDKYEEDMVEVYEYWEKGQPWNGYIGLHCWLWMNDTTVVLLGEMEENDTPDRALPYQIHTDIDVPGQIYGKSFVDYIARLQDILNRVDSFTYEQIQAHGNVRLVVFDDMQVDEQVNTDTYNILQLKGGNGGIPPLYIQPPQLMPAIGEFRQHLIEGMEALAGMNEQMFGQFKREISGYAAQSAINSANLTRRRFFVKFQFATESFFRLYLELVQSHYDESKKLTIVGKEDGVSLAFFNGADLAGEYDFDTDYGTSFSLDPESRREEVMQLKDLLVEAKYSATQILGFIRLSDSKGPVDLVSRAKLRQYEIFDKMEAAFMSGVPIFIAPEKNENHVPMLEACTEYRSSAQFVYMSKELQQAIDKHIDERVDMAASVAAGTAPGGQAAGGDGSGVAAGALPGVGGVPQMGSPDAMAAATALPPGAAPAGPPPVPGI